ncbi:transcription factor A, mitochondrial isoform X2 [Biomphalaria glabrata]|nr:transcription factor A, mitochondrial isoform X2 [Biomphalaria glabrata]
MAATIVGRLCNKWNYLFLNFKQLNNGYQQTLINQVRLLSLESNHNGQSKEGAPPLPNLQKPKFPSNVFFMYLSQVAPDMQKENPGIQRKELISKIAKMWKELDPEVKSQLSIQRKEMLEKYKQDMKMFLENITPDQISQLETKKLKNTARKKKLERKSLGHPKKPVGAFGNFVREKFSERTDEPVAQFFKHISDQWHTMSDKEKEPYVIKAEEGKASYKEQIKNWEKEMMSLGRFDLVRKGSLVELTQPKTRKNTRRNKPTIEEDEKK